MIAPGILPRGNVAETRVVPPGLAVGGLVFRSEVPAATLLTSQRVERKQFAELHEVRDAVGSFQRDVQVRVGTR